MQKIIKDIFFQRISKAIVDILLIIGLVLVIASSHFAKESWLSYHCIVSMSWFALMIVHIGQHWQMTKALITLQWKALKRNKITFITLIAFILMAISVILFMVAVSDKSVHFHHAIASPFRFVIIIHTITKIKQFVACFR